MADVSSTIPIQSVISISCLSFVRTSYCMWRIILPFCQQRRNGEKYDHQNTKWLRLLGCALLSLGFDVAATIVCLKASSTGWAFKALFVLSMITISTAESYNRLFATDEAFNALLSPALAFVRFTPLIWYAALPGIPSFLGLLFPFLLEFVLGFVCFFQFVRVTQRPTKYIFHFVRVTVVIVFVLVVIILGSIQSRRKPTLLGILWPCAAFCILPLEEEFMWLISRLEGLPREGRSNIGDIELEDSSLPDIEAGRKSASTPEAAKYSQPSSNNVPGQPLSSTYSQIVRALGVADSTKPSSSLQTDSRSSVSDYPEKVTNAALQPSNAIEVDPEDSKDSFVEFEYRRADGTTSKVVF